MTTPFKHLRLSHSKAIRAVFQSGKRLNDPHMRVLFRPTELDHPRLCIQVGKKVSKKAVVRNRIRRRTREAFCSHLGQRAAGMDLVVLSRLSVAKMPWQELLDRSRRLVARLP